MSALDDRIRVEVDHGTVWLHRPWGDAYRVDYDDLPALIAALVVAGDVLGDAR